MSDEQRMQTAREFLLNHADRLDRWAKESRDGGWSTHQVSANISAANDCRRIAALLKSLQAGEKP